jgi:penicillin-binding protein-related factor A (putative recombinase)
MPPKECPEGKVINPKTGRCINQKVEKQCPEGKVRNPKTGRCIQNKQEVPLREKSPKVQIFTVKVNGKDITFESHYENTYAFNKLIELVSSGQQKTSFAKDLVTKGPPFSTKQWAWVHKLVLDAEARQPKQKSASPKQKSASPTSRYTVTIKGQTITFESKHTHKEAFNILSGLVATRKVFSKFAKSLVEKGLENLTKTQMAWVHKLVLDEEARQPKQKSASPKNRYTVTIKGQTITFESKRTHNEAFKILSDLVAKRKVFSKLAQDLVKKGLENLTKTQIAWVHKIVVDNETQEPVERLAVPNIRALLHKAGEKLTAPTITFVKRNLELRITLLAKDHNRYPRQIYMTGLGDKYYGRIDDRGYVVAGKDLTKEIMDILRELEVDPEKYAAEYGKLTGRCCFCHRKLTTDPSIRMGYGETCAKHYRLPYQK